MQLKKISFLLIFIILALVSACTLVPDDKEEALNCNKSYPIGGNESIGAARKSGFYPCDFKVTFQSKGKGDLYYTLNGKDPKRGTSYTIKVDSGFNTRDLLKEDLSLIPTTTNDEDFKFLWQKPIDNPVKGFSFNVARILNDTIKDQKIFTYIISSELSQNPVKSVFFNIDRDDLFDQDSGVYVFGNAKKGNFEIKGKKGEQKSFMEYVNKKGEVKYSSYSGFSIHGYISRQNPQKSLKLSAREKYDNKNFKYDFYKDGPKKFKKLTLRSGASGWGAGIYKDCIISELVKGLNFEVGKQIPVIIFINGEYWGVHFLAEKIDRYYLLGNFDEKKSKINICRDNLKADYGSSYSYKSIIGFAIKNDLSNNSNYQKFDSLVDMESYIDWFIAETFFQNYDWPCNNTKLWNSEKSSKWRNFLVDMDAAITEPSKKMLKRSYDIDTKRETPVNRCNFLIRNLMRNESFRKEFESRVQKLLKKELSYENLNKTVSKYIDDFSHPALSNWHINRWGYPNLDDFESFEYKLTNWIKERQSFYLQEVEAFMEDGLEFSKSPYIPYK